MLSSGVGNNHLYCEEICGKDVMKRSVSLINDLTYYYVKELPNEKILLSYLTKSEKNGVPEYLYRFFGMSRIVGSFYQIIDHIKTY